VVGAMICHQPRVPNLGNGLHQMTPMEIQKNLNHGFKGGRARQGRPQTNHRGARNHLKSFINNGLKAARPRQRRPEPSTAENEIIQISLGARPRQRRPRTEHRGAQNHSKSFPARRRSNDALNRAPRNTKSFKIHSNIMDSKAADEATTPRIEHRGARNHSTSYLTKTINWSAAEATTSTNRAPRSKTTFKIRSKTMDSTAGDQGNDVPEHEIIQIQSKTTDPGARGRNNDAPNRAPRGTKSFKIRFETMDSMARGRGNDDPEKSTADYKIIQNPV
jgi:hypothetical protein